MDDNAGKEPEKQEETWQDRVKKYGKTPESNVREVERADIKSALGIAFSIFFVVITIFGIKSCISESPDEKAEKLAVRQARACKSESMAYVMSQHFIKQQLKSPDSAEFPTSAIQISLIGSCKFNIIAAFDAQNSFGAMLRNTYSIDMTYNVATESWSASNIEIR